MPKKDKKKRRSKDMRETTYHIECNDGSIRDYEACDYKQAYKKARMDGYVPIAYTKDVDYLHDLNDMWDDEAMQLISDWLGNTSDFDHIPKANEYWFYCKYKTIFNPYVDNDDECCNVEQEEAIDRVVGQAYKFAKLKEKENIVSAINKLAGYPFSWFDFGDVDERYSRVQELKKAIEYLYTNYRNKCDWDVILDDIKHDYLTMYNDCDGNTYLWYFECDNDDDVIGGMTNILMNIETYETFTDDDEIAEITKIF